MVGRIKIVILETGNDKVQGKFVVKFERYRFDFVNADIDRS